MRHPRAAALRELARNWLAEVRESLRAQADPGAWFHGYFLDRLCRTPPSIDFAELYPTLLSWRVRLSAGLDDLEWVQTDTGQRKQFGSYYTPESLVELLLQTTLDPLLEEARCAADVLRLTVCDPACGCGHLLRAAGRRLIAKLATFCVPEHEAAERVLEECLFGMDCDPRAVELCRAVLRSLWARASNPGPSPEGEGRMAKRPSPSGEGLGRGSSQPPEEKIRHGDSLFADWPRRFAVVLVNPPWGRVKARQDAQALASRLRASGRFPLSARGDLNLYPLFVELARDLLADAGRAGLVVPSGLGTQMATQPLFADLLDRGQLVSWFDFVNRRRLFPAVQTNVKFALVTLSKRPHPSLTVAAHLEHPDERHQPDRAYALGAEQLARLNPETRHLPSARRGRDARRLLAFHDRFPTLAQGWPVAFETTFHMTGDAHLFRTREQLDAAEARWRGSHCQVGERWYWPLYEAKLVHQYNHRHATFAGVPAGKRFGLHAAPQFLTPDELRNPALRTQPRYWVDGETARARRRTSWLLAVRNAVSASADARSLVAALLPDASAVGNSLFLVRVADLSDAYLLLALFNSLVLDHVVKQKASGSNLNFHILRQLPVPPPSAFAGDVGRRLTEKALELSRTTADVPNLCSTTRRPVRPRWDEARRFRLRCEIDAALLRLYGVDDLDAFLESFPVLERRERHEHGRFRTRDALRELLAAQ